MKITRMRSFQTSLWTKFSVMSKIKFNLKFIQCFYRVFKNMYVRTVVVLRVYVKLRPSLRPIMPYAAIQVLAI